MMTRRWPRSPGHGPGVHAIGWTLGLLVGFGLGLSAAAATSLDPPEPRVPTIRPRDREMLELACEGYAGSATFRRLVDRIALTSGVVSLQRWPRFPRHVDGATRLLSETGNRRYLLVRVTARAARPYRIAVLAHELQHAIEILEIPDRADRAAVQVLYSRIGTPVEGAAPDVSFETQAARDVKAAVLRDLARVVRPSTGEALRACSPAISVARRYATLRDER